MRAHPCSVPGAAGEPLLDHRVLEGLLALDENGDFLAELVDLFEAETPLRLAALRAAVAAGVVPNVVSIAHRMKGTARSLGLACLAASCQAIEDAGTNGLLPDPATLDRLHADTAKATGALQAQRGSRRG